MARFSEYADTNYLPGEVYSAGLGEYALEPGFKTDYIAEKKFKFKPDKDDGTYFQKFLTLQNNPELLAQQAFSSSPGFFQTMRMFGGQ